MDLVPYAHSMRSLLRIGDARPPRLLSFHRTAWALLGVACLGLLVPGCRGSSRSGAQAVPAQDFTLLLSASSLSIPAGGSAYVTVSVQRLNGMTGPIQLRLEGAPVGVSGSAVLAADTTMIPFPISAAPSLPVQTLTNLTLRGTAGTLNRALPLSLTILPALPPGTSTSHAVQASGGDQSGGPYQNRVVAMEPTAASTSNNASGTVQNRSGFHPAGQTN